MANNYGIKFSDEQAAQQHVIWLNYGKPGSGKTTLAKSAADPLRILVLAFEQKGISSLRHARVPFIMMNSTEQAFEIQAAIMQGELTGFDWVINDTITEFQSMRLRELSPAPRKPNFGDWDVLASDTERYVSNWSQAGVNVLFLAHHATIEEEDADGNKRYYIKPLLLGAATEKRNVFPRYADLISFSYTENAEDGSLKHKILLQGTHAIQARGRFGKNAVPQSIDITDKSSTLEDVRSLLVS